MPPGCGRARLGVLLSVWWPEWDSKITVNNVNPLYQTFGKSSQGHN